MDGLPAAKRAKTSGNESLATPSRKTHANFVDIPDDALLLLAQFASPPDVYNLCLTNQDRFFRSAGNAAPDAVRVASSETASNNNSNDNDDGNAAPVAAASTETTASNNNSTDDARRGGNAPNALVCTKLLRFSLLSSLSFILQNSKTKLSLDQVSFSEMPLGSVLIAGSTMVQCCLGERWQESDIDLFCTTSAAPAVRSWLVKEAGQLFQGFCDYMIGVEDTTHAVGSKKIHHVEYYCNLPEEGDKPVYFKPPFNYNQACEYGKTVNEKYAFGKWGGYYVFAPDRGVEYHPTVDIGNQYRIETAGDDSFPFNYLYDSRKDASFDLVVATDTCATAMELLEDFDLNICKASWNGRFFSIPDPHFTFTRRSRMEPQRKDLMESYKRHLQAVVQEDEGGDFAEAHARVASELVDSPFCRDVDQVVENVHLAFQFHNFVYKLYERLEKYQGRGIVVQEAPETEDFRLHYASMAF